MGPQKKFGVNLLGAWTMGSKPNNYTPSPISPKSWSRTAINPILVGFFSFEADFKNETQIPKASKNGTVLSVI